MSKIGPVQRDPMLNAEIYAGLNEPAPAIKRDSAPQVEPVKSLNKAELLGDHREIKPTVDDETDRLILQVVDKDSHEVVYQEPSEVVLRLARDLRQKQRRRGPTGLDRESA